MIKLVYRRVRVEADQRGTIFTKDGQCLSRIEGGYVPSLECGKGLLCIEVAGFTRDPADGNPSC